MAWRGKDVGSCSLEPQEGALVVHRVGWDLRHLFRIQISVIPYIVQDLLHQTGYHVAWSLPRSRPPLVKKKNA